MHDVKLAQQVQLFRAVLEEAPPTPHLAPSVWLLSEPGQSMMNPIPLRSSNSNLVVQRPKGAQQQWQQWSSPSKREHGETSHEVCSEP